MPIYEYICSDCKQKFELLKPMSKAEEAVLCPSCGGSAQRVLSVFSRSSEGSLASEGGSACSSCSATSCDSCSIAG